MSEWIAIAQWHQCRDLERPGIVFELQNVEGLSLFTPCTQDVPKAPFDWTSPPVRFRAIAEPKPERSSPLPSPRD
jgi:hypothetical protein